MASGNDQMMEMFLFEMSTLIEQLDEVLLSSEKSQELTEDAVSEIFRIMHTIKGSSAMMELDLISTVTHKLEDSFFLIREHGIDQSHFTELFDLMLDATDFLKSQLEAIQSGGELAEKNEDLINRAVAFYNILKEGETPATPAAPASPAAEEPVTLKPSAQPVPAGTDGAMHFEIFFEEDSGMENLRAFMLVNTLKNVSNILAYHPQDIETNPETAMEIMVNGFNITLESQLPPAQMQEFIEKQMYVSSATLLTEEELGRRLGKAADLSGVRYEAHVFFEEDCGMENLRAFMLVNSLRTSCKVVSFTPADIETNPESALLINAKGFQMILETPLSQSALQETLRKGMHVRSVTLKEADGAAAVSRELVGAAVAASQPQTASVTAQPSKEQAKKSPAVKAPIKQSLISVSLDKLDQLMDLMGELVITESMVVRSPDLKGLTKLDNFQKAERQLRKLTDELQDMVMSIRMIPVSGTFQKMQRIVRDMCRTMGKEAELVTMGEDTDIDKVIIDGISDPIMHLVRNAMDHGIEMPQERVAAGKPAKGTITLSAQNTGGEILITISDDGKGLDPQKLLEKAKKNGILTKPASEYTEKEAFMLLFTPGFSTKEEVSEYSGRGVGMDVVKKNIEKVGGTVQVESKLGYGMSVFLKIPLTLAIVDGMDVSLGGDIYTLQITSINESFKAKNDQVIVDTEGNEMIMIRGNVYPVVRLHELYNVPNAITDIEEGILIWVQSGDDSACLLVDELIGEQQIVVKPLPKYLNRFGVKGYGISGCTILGDGNISLILDVGAIIEKVLEKR
jgi:two-component system chemotaxis sensor kinase CheA